jgi:crotonobetainyl-CoA:carnitine CoA-transferase CaiB-like acyl-CoA transferase
MAGAALACRTLARHGGCDLVVDGPALLDREHPDVDGGGTEGVSAGGTARLLSGVDGLVAVNLPRSCDWDLVPAWLDWSTARRATWADIAETVRSRRTAPLVARAGEIGLAVAPCPAAGVAPDDEQIRHRHPNGSVGPWVIEGSGDSRGRVPKDLRVSDLSALWAGPLLGSLLAQTGAAVTKVEDPRRRDASRAEPTALAKHLNRSKRLVETSFDAEGRARLAALVEDADVVIESSRPRALDRLGVGPRHDLPPGQIWVSITAYGRTGPWSSRAGYGDDTAAAGGLYRGEGDTPAFVGDAVADPLTGLHGAVAVLAAVIGGWSGHLDLALRDTAATVGLTDRPSNPPIAHRQGPRQRGEVVAEALAPPTITIRAESR